MRLNPYYSTAMQIDSKDGILNDTQRCLMTAEQYSIDRSLILVSTESQYHRHRIQCKVSLTEAEILHIAGKMARGSS